MQKKLLSLIVSLVLVVAVLFPLSATAFNGNSNIQTDVIPMVFVHGNQGSAAQFTTQALRFASNGYPASYIAMYEYSSSRYLTDPDYRNVIIPAEIDALIASLLKNTGADQVNLLGHSMGTGVCQSYLNSDPGRAANVAHYVNLDGGSATSLPGGVPTLAVWGRSNDSREIVGATNVYFPNCTHSEVVAHDGTFVEMYKFFNDEDPLTTCIVPEPPGLIRLAGRVIFAAGPVLNNTLEIWEINSDTGMRIGKKPKAIYPLAEDGAWGPFSPVPGAHYEYCVLSGEGYRTHHFYREPPMRSNYWIRMTYYGVTGLDTSDNHSNIYFSRNKEFWGDQWENNDTLLINGVNIINNVTVPISNVTNSIIVYDLFTDQVTHLDWFIELQRHAIAVDYFIPAADPPNATISVVLFPRYGGGLMQRVNVPNWSSAQDSITISFNDFVQDFNSWTEYVKLNE